LIDKVNSVIEKYDTVFLNYFGLSGFDGYKKRCGGTGSHMNAGINEYTDQFPLEVNVKKGDYVSSNDLKKDFGLSDFCIESFSYNPNVFMFSDTGLFEFEKNGDCVTKVDVKKDGKVYLWVYYNPALDEKTVYVDESRPYVDLGDGSGYKDTIKYSGSHPTLRRIHYKNNDYIMVFCASFGSGCMPIDDFAKQVNDMEKKDKKYSIPIALCDLDGFCNQYFLNEKSGIQFSDIFVTYDGILEDMYGKYIQFTVEGV